MEDHLWDLLQECRSDPRETPLFFLINAYTARLSPTVVANLLSQLLRDFKGSISAGEVGLPVHRDGKVLPCGIYGRWEATELTSDLKHDPMPSIADIYYERAAGLLARARETNAPVIAKLAPVIGSSRSPGVESSTPSAAAIASSSPGKSLGGPAGSSASPASSTRPAGFIENLPGYGLKLVERYDRQYQLNRRRDRHRDLKLGKERVAH